MMLYMASNKKSDIYFAVHQCSYFTHNTKASHETDVNSICWYLQVTKHNVLVFNSSKKLVVGCYADADCAGLWGHENHQDTIRASIITGCVVTFANFPLLWVSKI